MIIDVGALGEWASAVLALFGLVSPILFFLYKQYRKLEDMKSWNAKQQKDIDRLAEEQALQTNALKALLEAQRDGRSNGNVTGAIAEIEKWEQEKAHENVSKMNYGG